jgi:GSH-dependent disulfide-bond oxidoreductase
MIDLYYAPTANGQRAAAALEEMGLEYRPHKVDLAKGEQRTPEFLKLNPAGLIPVIVDSDGPNGQPLTLTQSCAIIVYCAEKSGKFLPREAALRAEALQWVLQTASDVAATSGALFRLENSVPEKSQPAIEYFHKRLLGFFSVCDQRLQGRDWLAGEFSVADLALYPNFFARKALIDQAGGFSNLQRWGATMAARPGVARAMKL